MWLLRVETRKTIELWTRALTAKHRLILKKISSAVFVAILIIANAGEVYAAPVSSPVVSPVVVLQKSTEVKKVEKTVEDLVREYFADTPVLAEVARCESAFRQFGKDGKVLRGLVDSRDVGVMQINEYYHLSRSKKLGFDIYSIEGNMAYAKFIYNEKGSQPWKASAPCWGKSVAVLTQKDTQGNTQVALNK